MSEYISDEEQMNRFGEWWKENGTTLLIALGVAVAAFVGWNVYSDQRQQTVEDGTSVYAEYVDATDEAQRKALAQRIKTEYPDSSFAVMVAFSEAKAAVDEGDLEAAERALTAARQSASNSLLSDLASLRLAKVQYAGGDATAALKSLQSIRNPGYQSLALELTGDIHLAEGDSEQAHAAYISALEAENTDGNNRPLLEIKRDNAAPTDGQFSAFTQPLDRALQQARETLAADDAAESTTED